MIILLRGHIRQSFNDSKLYNLIKKICMNYKDVQIFIHTWDIIQTSISWRKLNNINIVVTETMIKNYFRGLTNYIKNITIDNDKKIQLIGNKFGVISLTQCPLIGWKNMWYGKKSAIDSMMGVDLSEPIINMRFDIFSNSNSFTENFILNFIESNKNNHFERNVLPFYTEQFGIDNIYIGNFNTMFNLIYNFHYNMDAILSKNTVTNQEFLVFRENSKLFNS